MGELMFDSCGTPSGYRRHIRTKTTPCPACRRAIAEYMKQYRHDRGLSKSRLVPDTVIAQHGIKVGT